MEGVFISYRRDDSAGHTGRLFDRLADQFGKDRVFMDISDIEPGVDFVDTIERALTDCQVLLLVIGQDWAGCVDAQGRRRLDDPHDFIRLETATSLRRNIRVIPVLVQGARMPAAADLPEELQGLTRRQAIDLSDTRWDYDTQQLIETLEKILPAASVATSQPPAATPETPPPSQKKKKTPWLAMAILVVLVALTGAVILTFVVKDPAPKITVAKEEPEGISKGARVPDVVGQQVGNSKWKIEKSGFTLGTVKVEHTDKVNPGTVLSQTPKSGGLAELKAPINLVIAEAPEEKALKVPDLTGMSFDRAREILVKNGLIVGKRSPRETPDKTPGTIVRQSPPAGSLLAQGKSVDLVIATKPVEQLVPDVIGKDIGTARSLLKKAGLQVRKIGRKMVFDPKEEGIVLGQRPGPESQASPASQVSLVVGTLPTIHASGGLEVNQTFTVDLDTGRVGIRNGEDLWFHAVTSKERYLEPTNGAMIAFFSGELSARPPEICVNTKLSTARIPIEKIRAKTSLCVRTDEGRYSFVRFLAEVEPNSGVLRFKYLTWKKI